MRNPVKPLSSFKITQMLNCSNIHVAYREKQVLTGLNFIAPIGEITGIVGLNGTGKTTLLNTIYGTVKSQQGTINFNNKPLEAGTIAYLETHNFFYQRITGGEYLQLFRIQHPNFDIEEWNKVFRLPLNKLVDTYSTGMKKKLAFMGILSLNRPIIMLDEPFNGLDLETNETLKSILEILRSKQKTIIVTSHILDTLTTTCDSIHYLNNGIIEQKFEAPNYEPLKKLLAKFAYSELESLVDGLSN